MQTLVHLCDNIPLNATNNSLKIYSKSCLHSFVFHEISENEVNACIDNIKTDSAYGIDGIPLKFVKMAKSFNICIKDETFLDEFKIAYVIPIP